jgi:pyruvate formate lyase activating enzyme
MFTLGGMLAERVREAELYQCIDGARVRCFACGHCCSIPEGQAGVCKVRFNRSGKLFAPWGYVACAQCDPIEKKPFYHVRPGSSAFSFGMLGCDLHCPYCQNWEISQVVRDSQAGALTQEATPGDLVDRALRSGASAVISTYNEPLITAEWAVSVFREAKAAGLMTGFVSNGNATPRALEYLRPWTDLFKVDLKGFEDSSYRRLGARLEPVLDSIRRIHAMGFWLEVVTLVVPGCNDSSGELRRIAEFLAGISPAIPWHLTAFHPDYKMAESAATPVETLLRAAGIGVEAGLRYVYAGNLPGDCGELEDTRCHGCGTTLIRRLGFRILENGLGPDGRCPRCAVALPGVF